LGQLIVIIAMLALVWLLLIRPARRRQVVQRELHTGIEVGDEIVTAGGVYGHVVEAHEEDELLVAVTPAVNLRIARRAVAAVIPPEVEEEAEEAEEEALMEAAEDDEEGSPRANPNETNRG
jgi:preprotein translocase subunit YajC